jgi:hypothetical protein
MAQTRYGDLRDTFHLSRLTNNGLLMHADFFSILLEGFIHAQSWTRRARHERAWCGGPNGI